MKVNVISAHTKANSFPGSTLMATKGSIYRNENIATRMSESEIFEIFPVLKIFSKQKPKATNAAVGCTSLPIGKIDMKGNKQHKKNKFANL